MADEIEILGSAARNPNFITAIHGSNRPKIFAPMNRVTVRLTSELAPTLRSLHGDLIIVLDAALRILPRATSPRDKVLLESLVHTTRTVGLVSRMVTTLERRAPKWTVWDMVYGSPPLPPTQPMLRPPEYKLPSNKWPKVPDDSAATHTMMTLAQEFNRVRARLLAPSVQIDKLRRHLGDPRNHVYDVSHPGSCGAVAQAIYYAFTVLGFYEESVDRLLPNLGEFRP